MVIVYDRRNNLILRYKTSLRPTYLRTYYENREMHDFILKNFLKVHWGPKSSENRAKNRWVQLAFLKNRWVQLHPLHPSKEATEQCKYLEELELKR